MAHVVVFLHVVRGVAQKRGEHARRHDDAHQKVERKRAQVEAACLATALTKATARQVACAHTTDGADDKTHHELGEEDRRPVGVDAQGGICQAEGNRRWNAQKRREGNSRCHVHTKPHQHERAWNEQEQRPRTCGGEEQTPHTLPSRASRSAMRYYEFKPARAPHRTPSSSNRSIVSGTTSTRNSAGRLWPRSRRLCSTRAARRRSATPSTTKRRRCSRTSRAGCPRCRS